MARIVLGLASSHTPQLSTGTKWWEDHAGRDRRNKKLLGRDGEYHTYDEIEARPEWNVPADSLTPEVWDGLYERSQASIAALAERLAAVAPDVIVIIGDDQLEMFRDDSMPAFAAYYGEEIYDLPATDEKKSRMAEGMLAALWAAHSDEVDKYETHAAMGLHIIEQLVLDEFDIVSLQRQPADRSLGHAFTFARRRLGSGSIPIVPVWVNSYNPPSQPSPRRCFNLGRSLRRAIESYPDDLRVAIVASGGLSHFVVDEELDQRILAGLKDRDAESLTTIPRKMMRSGTSEGLNWIAAGGALEGLEMTVLDYIPAYRSTAGTGVGMAFAAWE